MEDYEEGGQVTVSSLRDALEGLQIDGLEGELLDFAIFWGYSRGGEDLQAVRYQVLLDAVDGLAGKGTGEGRKRPESSSPAQLKARNKEKYSLEGSGNAKGGSGNKEEQSPEGAAEEEEEEDYKEE